MDLPGFSRETLAAESDDTARVLREFGFDDGEVAALAEAGDIGAVG